MEVNTNARLIAIFSDKTYVAFTRGQFDCYRVTFFDNDGKKTDSPKDTYFMDFYVSLIHGPITGKKVFKAMKDLSKHIVKGMEEDFDFLEPIIEAKGLELDVPDMLRFKKATMAILAAMLSEEEKRFSMLGKKLKLLGLYQSLVEGMDTKEVSNWSKGRKWRDIQAEYERLGV